MKPKGVALPERPNQRNFHAVYHLGARHPMNGQPVSFGHVRIFRAGTSIPVLPFCDAELAIPHTVPTDLDGEGWADIYLQPEQKIRVEIQDRNGAPVETYETEV